MIVIQQTPFNGCLPQPSGTSSSSKTADEENLAQLFGQENAGSSDTQIKTRLRKRMMARSTSMFPAVMENHSFSSGSLSSLPSSRASSSSSRSSPGLQANVTSTPPSTVASTVSAQTSKGARKTKVVQTPLDLSQKGKAKSVNVQDDPAAISYDIPEISLPPFARPTSNAIRDMARTWEAVANARRIVVICGAGISVSSPANIPDFRSAQGLFRKLKEKHPNVGLQSGKDLFDANLFKSPSTSALFYSMVSELKAMADAAAPTSFHHLLKRLDMEGRLMRVYTQNIDGLEEKAGLTFGLGDTGDSRKTLRALGKRKREAVERAGLGRNGMARCKSDSAVIFGKRSSNEEPELTGPMFPRAIPLHGSLSTMTCQVCGHKIYLSLASPGPQKLPPSVRELSPDASDQAVSAMDLLSQGESVECKRCVSAEEVRSVAGLRSRGVGMMKVDVVLYNGQNEGAERVGDCVERDILGLRDPNESLVPENGRERILRERKERKEEALANEKAAATASDSVGILQPILENATADDAFAAAFDEDDKDARLADDLIGQSPPSQLSFLEQTKPKRQPKLKPLPPDLLIVAGTSLKVPGTKRIVREFAKSCQARDHREFSNSDSDDESRDRSRSSSPRNLRSKTKKGENDEGAEDDDEDEEDDINAPIRTILLNYDFPLPHTQWEDVFDVWVQGDVQQAALGLWEATKFPSDQAVNDFSMSNDEHHSLAQPELSWSVHQEALETERKEIKRAAAAASAALKKIASQSSSQKVKKESSAPSSQLSQTSSQKKTAKAKNDKAPPKPKPNHIDKLMKSTKPIKSTTAKAK